MSGDTVVDSNRMAYGPEAVAPTLSLSLSLVVVDDDNMNYFFMMILMLMMMMMMMVVITIITIIIIIIIIIYYYYNHDEGWLRMTDDSRYLITFDTSAVVKPIRKKR